MKALKVLAMTSILVLGASCGHFRGCGKSSCCDQKCSTEQCSKSQCDMKSGQCPMKDGQKAPAETPKA